MRLAVYIKRKGRWVGFFQENSGSFFPNICVKGSAITQPVDVFALMVLLGHCCPKPVGPRSRRVGGCAVAPRQGHSSAHIVWCLLPFRKRVGNHTWLEWVFYICLGAGAGEKRI